MPSTWTESGRGRKQCEHCGIYYSARARVCARCGKAPNITRRPKVKVKPKKKTKEPEAPQGKRAVVIPSGEPPVRLEACDEGSVQLWAQEVCSALEDTRTELHVSALAYWVRRAPLEPGGCQTALQHLRRWNRVYRGNLKSGEE